MFSFVVTVLERRRGGMCVREGRRKAIHSPALVPHGRVAQVWRGTASVSPKDGVWRRRRSRRRRFSWVAKKTKGRRRRWRGWRG